MDRTTSCHFTRTGRYTEFSPYMKGKDMAAPSPGITTGNQYSRWEEFIVENDHPCLMAQAVIKSSNVVIKEYEAMGSAGNSRRILQDITAFLASYNFQSEEFHSFIAVFDNHKAYSEPEFEELLWEELQSLHLADHQNEWDPAVSANPDDASFSFSVGGKAFYIVGMHPNSSRMARRFTQPALVFNLHLQFERLRAKGIYTDMRIKIQERDRQLQGTVNPMLNDYGAASEARQYSGRAVPPAWKCPFMAG